MQTWDKKMQLWLLQVELPLRVLWGYSDATVTKTAEYPCNTLHSTATCSSHNSTALYETHVAFRLINHLNLEENVKFWVSLILEYFVNLFHMMML